MDFPSHIQLPESAREELIELLNEHLANALDLATQLKQAHWNVRGRHFLSLHELFDELSEHVYKHTDELAERLAALGGYAEGTARLVAKNSRLSEYDLEAVDGEDHLSALVHAYASYSGGFRNAIARCAELDDPATEDLFTQLLREVEKDLWFLESHLLHEGQTARGRGAQNGNGAHRRDDEGQDAPRRARDENREGGEATASRAEEAFDADEDDESQTPWRDVKPPPH